MKGGWGEDEVRPWEGLFGRWWRRVWVFVEHSRSWWAAWWQTILVSPLNEGNLREIKWKYSKMMFLSHTMLRSLFQYSEALKCSCLSSAGTPCSDCSKNHSRFYLLSSLLGGFLTSPHSPYFIGFLHYVTLVMFCQSPVGIHLFTPFGDHIQPPSKCCFSNEGLWCHFLSEAKMYLKKKLVIC